MLTTMSMLMSMLVCKRMRMPLLRMRMLVCMRRLMRMLMRTLHIREDNDEPGNENPAPVLTVARY